MTADQLAIDALRAAQASAGHAWASAWAAWVIGIVGVVVNFGGLILIREQLKSSRAAIVEASASSVAASDAAKAALATSRPWLKIGFWGSADYARASDDPQDPHPGMIGITVTWKNVGQVPASDICCFAELLDRPTQAEADEALKAILARENFVSSSLFPGEEDLTERRFVVGPQRPNKGWLVLLLVRYRTPGTDSVHYSGQVVGVTPAMGVWGSAPVGIDRSIRIDPT